MTRWLYHHDEGGVKHVVDMWRDPAPTVCADGLFGDNLSHYYFTTEGGTFKMSENKPQYRVPTMAEVKALPWNGYTAVSTFSGAGGSSLGYKLAGFKVLWASEFVPAAQECYRANHDGTFLDVRDVRDVQPEDVLRQTGLARGELDLFDGSPPCASFSTAGKRHKGWGQVKKYSDVEQRTDDLFFEYVRLVKGIQPKVFVAENVSGLVRGVAKGYFIEILKALKACGYDVEAKLLDAQWLGVPQMRQRIIFVGVRSDLARARNVKPVHPAPLSFRYAVREAIPLLVGMGKDERLARAFDAKLTPDGAAPTVPATPEGGSYPGYYAEFGEGGNGAGFAEAAPIADNVVDRRALLKPGSVDEKVALECRPGQNVAELYDGTYGFTHVRAPTDAPANTVIFGTETVHPTEKRRFTIAELKRICAFPDDFVVTGTYAQQWERLGRAVPPIMMWHVARTIRGGVLDAVYGRAPYANDPPALLETLAYSARNAQKSEA